MLTQYTSFDEIRAVLGVAEEELEDSVLVRPIYEAELYEDLEDTGTGLVDLFITVSAIPYTDRSDVQKRFYKLVRVFSAYSVARTLLTSLPYFAEHRVEDGRAAKERITDPYALTAAGVNASFAAMRLKLSAVFVALSGSGTPLTTQVRVYTLATGLATDPVTNT